MVLRLFDLIRRVREEGYTILVVEQNVRQVLKLVDRAYLLEVGRIKMEGRAAELAEQDFVRKAYVGLGPASHRHGERRMVRARSDGLTP